MIGRFFKVDQQMTDIGTDHRYLPETVTILFRNKPSPGLHMMSILQRGLTQKTCFYQDLL